MYLFTWCLHLSIQEIIKTKQQKIISNERKTYNNSKQIQLKQQLLKHHLHWQQRVSACAVSVIWNLILENFLVIHLLGGNCMGSHWALSNQQIPILHKTKGGKNNNNNKRKYKQTKHRVVLQSNSLCGEKQTTKIRLSLLFANLLSFVSEIFISIILIESVVAVRGFLFLQIGDFFAKKPVTFYNRVFSWRLSVRTSLPLPKSSLVGWLTTGWCYPCQQVFSSGLPLWQ